MTEEEMPDLNAPGWDGQTIPIEAQAIVIAKHYRGAVAMAAANIHRLHQQIEELFADSPDPGTMMDKLQSNPFFVRTLNKLVESHDEFEDKSFRKTAGQMFDESRDELEDMIVWMCIGLWILNGAEFPEGFLEEVESFDEEE